MIPPGRRPLWFSAIVLAAPTLLLAACDDDQAADDEEMVANFPEREITLINRGSAGSGHDQYARALSPLLEEYLGATVINENMPGGAGVVAADFMRNSAEPDGHTIHLMDPAGLLGDLIAENEDFDFDAEFDWPWLGTISQRSTSFVVGSNSEYEDWDTFLEDLQAGGLRWAITGLASPHVYNVAILFSDLGIPDPLFVPHEATPDVFTSLLRGDSDFGVQSVDSVIENVQRGDARALIHFNEESLEDLLPGVPQGADVGLGEYDGLLMTSLALVAPPDTPEPIVEQLREAIDYAVNSDELAAWAEDGDRLIEPLDPEETEQQLREVVALYQEYREDILELIGEG